MGDSRINRVSQEDINTLQDKLDILKEHIKNIKKNINFISIIVMVIQLVNYTVQEKVC